MGAKARLYNDEASSGAASRNHKVVQSVIKAASLVPRQTNGSSGGTRPPAGRACLLKERLYA